MSPPYDLASVIADPEWLPFQYDWQRGALGFARISRAEHARLTFLSDEYVQPTNAERTSATVSEVEKAASRLDGAPHYIFHSAFACSTLLARALDVTGAAMALNEPQIVNQLAAAAMQKRLSAAALETVMRLLARPFAPGEAIVVKPSNEANLLAEPLLNLDKRSRAIFLYAPLPRFLASVAKKGMFGRIWSRRVFTILRTQTGLHFVLGEAELFQLTDMQVAALTWLSHHAQAAAMLAAFPDRVRTLDSETFLANRERTLGAVGQQFGIELDAAALASGPAFSRHSKEIGRSIDPEAPLDPPTPMPVVDEEIAMVSTWARSVADHAGVPFDLPEAQALLKA